MNVPREINADAAKRLATEKHTPMMHGYVLE
jgi:DNA mismatch repair protein MutS